MTTPTRESRLSSHVTTVLVSIITWLCTKLTDHFNASQPCHWHRSRLWRQDYVMQYTAIHVRSIYMYTCTGATREYSMLYDQYITVIIHAITSRSWKLCLKAGCDGFSSPCSWLTNKENTIWKTMIPITSQLTIGNYMYTVHVPCIYIGVHVFTCKSSTWHTFIWSSSYGGSG